MPSSAFPIAEFQQRDRRPPLTLAAPQKNVRPVLLLAPQEAPDPPRSGDVPTRAARMPLYVFTAIKAHLAVAQDEFFVRGEAPPPQVSMPRGQQEPIGPDRRNINAAPADSFGSQLDDVYAGMP